MIETKGLGAGSYPEPEVEEEKAYRFTCECYAEYEFVVYAEDIEQAREKLKGKDYNEAILQSLEIEGITKEEEEE